MRHFALSAVVVALGLSLAGASFAADKPAGGRKGGGKHAAKVGARLERIGQKLGERINKIKDRLAAHPNAPASVKAAGDRLLGSLGKRQDDVGKAKAAVQARDKTTAKALKGTLKSDRAAVHADRKALRAAVHSAVTDVRGILGRGGKHGGQHGHKHKGGKQNVAGV
ncbi:MAG: hypothetical protein NTW87_13650 [Planctomycetota bacterium]|nr:hypothetical protein [Planctomycetota bacterium]